MVPLQRFHTPSSQTALTRRPGTSQPGDGGIRLEVGTDSGPSSVSLDIRKKFTFLAHNSQMLVDSLNGNAMFTTVNMECRH